MMECSVWVNAYLGLLGLASCDVGLRPSHGVLKGQKNMESTLAKKKPTVRREWTKDDVKELKAHSKARTPVVKIAKMTKRTEGALRQKALQLGVGLGHQR